MNAKSIGIFGLLVALFLFMAFMTADPWYAVSDSTFLLSNNIENLLRRISMYGLLGIGVAFVIITGGIDLSVGSVVCLAGCLLGIFLQVDYNAADSLDVYRVNAADKTIILRGDASERFSRGDPIRLFQVRDPAVLTVQSAELVQLADETGKPTELGTLLSVEGELQRDDQSGTVARAFRISDYSPGSKLGENTDESGDTLEISQIPFQLHPRDRLILVHPTSKGLLEAHVAVATKEGDQTTAITTQPLNDTFATDWLAIPMKRQQRMPIPLAILSVLAITGCLGAVHGLLVTRARLQPFVVTLCGLLIYRGVSRWLVNDNPVGFGIEYQNTLSPLGSGKLPLIQWAGENGPQSFGIPYPFFVFIVVAVIAAIFLNLTIWGRYLLALGSNEEAARYSGIRTERITVLAYVIGTVAAGVGGMLFALDSGSISPSSFGNFFELYAIAAAVLGGCSLRGGEGSIFGVIAGTAVMMLLNNLILLLKIADRLEFTIIGLVILLGVFMDETVRRIAARRRAMKS
jgi:ribose transport system permease protein